MQIIQDNNSKMSMSQGERIRRIQEEANKYIARNKVRDSSELTLMKQSKGSSVVQPNIVVSVANLHTSQIIPPYQGQDSCAANVVYTGVGTQYDYTAILQKGQSCATCSDDDPALNPYITLPTPCYNRLEFPFVQQNLSTAVTCTPGFVAYERREPICYSNTNIYIYPS